MDEILENLLRSLNSDENRLKFLKNIYSHGNRSVIDKILELSLKVGSIDDYFSNQIIIENEIAFSKQSGDEATYTRMAKISIDYRLTYEAQGSSLPLIVLKLKEKRFITYGLNQISEKAEIEEISGNYENAAKLLISAITIIDNTKFEDVHPYLERLLRVQRLMPKMRSQFDMGTILTRLGRYNEAIDEYLASDVYFHLEIAKRIAIEKSPNRLHEIEIQGFLRFSDIPSIFISDRIDFYFKCAESLGKKDEAIKNLANYAKNIRTESEHPLDINDETINILISKGLDDIAVDLSATGDKNTLYEMKRLSYEDQGYYDSAAKMAIKLGNPDLATEYKTMNQMINR